ncbi:MAG: RNA polymerase sigma factor [Saprospiraceae bacterium]
MKTLQTIITESIEGIEESQRELYLRYRSKWYMLCLRYGKNKYEADDIFQEGLIRVYKDLHQFDETRSGFETWSSRLMSHAALRYLKKNNWHQAITNIEEVQEAPDEQETVYDHLAAKELTSIIQELPIGYRLVFNMYVLEGYSHKEIATELNISEGTSKSQLFKAKKMLRGKIEFQLMGKKKELIVKG